MITARLQDSHERRVHVGELGGMLIILITKFVPTRDAKAKIFFVWVRRRDGASYSLFGGNKSVTNELDPYF